MDCWLIQLHSVSLRRIKIFDSSDCVQWQKNPSLNLGNIFFSVQNIGRYNHIYFLLSCGVPVLVENNKKWNCQKMQSWWWKG